MASVTLKTANPVQPERSRGRPHEPALATPPPASKPAGWRASSTATRAAASGPSLPPPKTADLRQDVFGSGKGWKSFFVGKHYGEPASKAPFAERVSQRIQIAKGDPKLGPDGAIFTETKAVVKATPEKILAQLRDPHFWNNGAVDDWAGKPDGSFTYALWPAGHMAGVKVNETMHAPERQADGSYVVRIDLSRQGEGFQIVPGQAQGRAYLQLTPRPDGSTEVAGRFAGVQESNLLFSAQQFGENHLLGERGELKAGGSFINHLLPNGTGFGAMLERAERLTAPR